MLFVGTDKPLPRSEWSKEAPNVWVGTVGENEAAVTTHFTKPAIQYVGSTAGCGCDFPHWILFNGEIPADEFDGRDEDQKKCNCENARKLVTLLRCTGESSVELYGVWAGNWAKSPVSMKSILLEEILDPGFLFGEQVFYRIQL